MVRSAAYLGQTPEQLQKTGVALLEYLRLSSHPRPAPSAATPPSLTGPGSYTTTWSASDIGQRWDVQAQFSLTSAEAQKLGVELVDYLLAISGH